jgi:DNA-binding CsgD family transcriptional regulator
MKTKGGARPGSGRKPTQISESRALTLWKDGASKKEIAKRFGIDYEVILYFFRKHKIFNRGKLRNQAPQKPR